MVNGHKVSIQNGESDTHTIEKFIYLYNSNLGSCVNELYVYDGT